MCSMYLVCDTLAEGQPSWLSSSESCCCCALAAGDDPVMYTWTKQVDWNSKTTGTYKNLQRAWASQQLDADKYQLCAQVRQQLWECETERERYRCPQNENWDRRVAFTDPLRHIPCKDEVKYYLVYNEDEVECIQCARNANPFRCNVITLSWRRRETGVYFQVLILNAVCCPMLLITFVIVRLVSQRERIAFLIVQDEAWENERRTTLASQNRSLPHGGSIFFHNLMTLKSIYHIHLRPKNEHRRKLRQWAALKRRLGFQDKNRSQRHHIIEIKRNK